MTNKNIDLSFLPGAELVEQGLKDLDNEKLTVESLLLLEAAPALKRLGFDIKAIKIDCPYKHKLYALLEEREADNAYSLYNSFMRRISSFIHALEA